MPISIERTSRPHSVDDAYINMRLAIRDWIVDSYPCTAIGEFCLFLMNSLAYQANVGHMLQILLEGGIEGVVISTLSLKEILVTSTLSCLQPQWRLLLVEFSHLRRFSTCSSSSTSGVFFSSKALMSVCKVEIHTPVHISHPMRTKRVSSLQGGKLVSKWSHPLRLATRAIENGKQARV